MTLERKAIRLAATEILLGRTAAGSKVKAERVFELWDNALPAIGVHTHRERVSNFDVQGNLPRRRHILELAADLYVRDKDGSIVEDVLDDLVEQVVVLWETLVFGPEPFPSIENLTILGEESGLDSIDIAFDAKGREIAAGARITFTVAYLRLVGGESLEELDWAKNLAVDWDFSPPDGTSEAEDLIDLTP